MVDKEVKFDMMGNEVVNTYTENQVKDLFMSFYEQVKHGDQEHQDWLRDETLKFIKERLVDKISHKGVILNFGNYIAGTDPYDNDNHI